MHARLHLTRAQGLRPAATLAITRAMGIAVWAITVIPTVVLIV